MPADYKRVEKDVAQVKRLRFSYFARRLAVLSGRPLTFLLALAAILLWGLSGPFFGFSDTWQLVINTSTTIITFLMVFLIQNTQNRDTEAIQIKLDELIRAIQGAHLVLLDLEELTDEELDHMKARYATLAKQARDDLRRGRKDSGTPELAQE